jgi:lysophospholipase
MIRSLIETASNPIPAGTRVDSFDLPDRKQLRYAIIPAGTPHVRGTVIILHGRSECIEKYFETARDMAARGFTVATFDWRGQGASSRVLRDAARGHIGSFDHYVADFENFFETVLLPDCRGPFYVLAHSTGALIALLAAPSMSNRIHRMVLASPLLDIPMTRLQRLTARIVANTLRSIGLGRTYMLSGPYQAKPFENNPVTSDATRYQRQCEILEQAPELALGGPTASWIIAAAKAINRVNRPEFIEKIRIPMLIVAAGADRIVSTPAIERYALQLRNTTLLTIDGSRHEILQEADFYREQFLAAFDAFIPGTGHEPSQLSDEADITG